MSRKLIKKLSQLSQENLLDFSARRLYRVNSKLCFVLNEKKCGLVNTSFTQCQLVLWSRQKISKNF